MTPADIRAARARLGLSAAALAAALKLGTHGGRTVRRWEAGQCPIQGPAEVAIGYMLREQGHVLVRPSDRRRPMPLPTDAELHQTLADWLADGLLGDPEEELADFLDTYREDLAADLTETPTPDELAHVRRVARDWIVARAQEQGDRDGPRADEAREGGAA